MNERDVDKLLGPTKRRLQNMIARGVVALSDASKMMQALQVKLLANETTDSLEHFEPYGFTSRPLAGAEAVTVFVDGDRSHGLCLVVADRRYRMTGFEEGEVALHDDQGQSVHLTRTGIVIKGGGLPIRIEDTPSVTMVANLEVTGSVAFNGGTLTHNGVNVGSTHKHSGVQSGASNTGNPI